MPETYFFLLNIKIDQRTTLSEYNMVNLLAKTLPGEILFNTVGNPQRIGAAFKMTRHLAVLIYMEL